MIFTGILAVVLAYLLGNCNGAVIVSALVAHDDVRRHGSGNAGLTNFVRNYGGVASLLVTLIDMGKAVLACLLGGFLMKRYGLWQDGMMLGAIGVSFGHDFPALLRMKGGKGVLCGFTVAMVLDWRVGLMGLAAFVLLYLPTQYVSLGSIGAALGCLAGFVIFHRAQPLQLWGGVLLCLMVIFMHRANIRRLIKGTETKTSLGKKKNTSHGGTGEGGD